MEPRKYRRYRFTVALGQVGIAAVLLLGCGAFDTDGDGVKTVSVASASPTINATINATLQPSVVAERCQPTSAVGPAAQLRFGAQPFCTTWRDAFQDESGYKVVLRYPRAGVKFEHAVGPNQSSFIFPDEEAPGAIGAGQCEQRSTFVIELSVIRGGLETPYDAITFQAECQSR